MNRLVRTAFLAACAAVIVGCGNDTAPSTPTVKSRFPMLVNEGGHILSPLRILAVVAANDPLRDSLFAFVKAMPASQWWPAVATPYDVSPTLTSDTVTGPPIASGAQVMMADVDSYVTAAAIDSAGYIPDGHTVYVLFLPTGVSFVGSIYGNFHTAFDTLNALAIIGRFQSSTMQTLTISASHEIIESATDPELNAWRLSSGGTPWEVSPWGLDDGGVFEENADICQGTKVLEAGFYYQRVFSNQAAALGGDPCVPAIQTPYFNVTTIGWDSTTTGEVSIPITGWSVGTVPDWVILTSAGPRTTSLPAPTIAVSCPDTVLVNGGRYCGLNNGKTAMLHVVLPPGAGSRSFFSVHLFSYTATNGPNGPLGGGLGQDDYHSWILGVYVP